MDRHLSIARANYTQFTKDTCCPLVEAWGHSPYTYGTAAAAARKTQVAVDRETGAKVNDRDSSQLPLPPLSRFFSISVAFRHCLDHHQELALMDVWDWLESDEMPSSLDDPPC